MCGILGIYNVNTTNRFDKEEFGKALSVMLHRGPDAVGTWEDEEQIILGHRRLSIIDLNSESNQPFQLDDRYYIVYNGEIFNYIELRNELRAIGYSFRTDSDTEVLLQAYIHWGMQCQNRLNGMWAFAIYDKKEKSIFCSRDRFGIKPFNYSLHNNTFIFSSEIKAILLYYPELCEPNFNVIANFCRTSVGAQHHETWFKNVLRLRPAHSLCIGKHGKITVERYWDYPETTFRNLTMDNAIKDYKNLFIDSVKLRMRSDVPVGTSLSAGLDSTSIVAALRSFYYDEHHTFTAAYSSNLYLRTEYQNYKEVGFEINEAVEAQKTSFELGLEHELVELNYVNLVDDLRDIIWHLESGNSSPAILPSMRIMQAARKKVTVLFEGQGADETLGGYVGNLIIPTFISYIHSGKFITAINFVYESLKTTSWQSAILLFFRKLSNSFPVIGKIQRILWGLEDFYGTRLQKYHPIKDYPEGQKYKKQTYLNRILIKEHIGGLVNLLHYGDALSMAHSIETRLPFLDHRLVEFAFRLPTEFKMSKGMGKYIHRLAMKGIVNDKIRLNKLKLGFNSPIGQYFLDTLDMSQHPKEVLTSETSLSRGIFKKEGILRLFKEHTQGQRNHAPLLFRLLCVELWFRIFIDNEQQNGVPLK